MRERRPHGGHLCHVDHHFAHAVIDAFETIHFESVGIGEFDEAMPLVHFLHTLEYGSKGCLAGLHDRLHSLGDVSEQLENHRRNNEAHNGEHPVVPDEHASERHHLHAVTHQDDAGLARIRECHIRLKDEL